MIWMDVSRDDDNEVNSVVVGCDVDGLRSVSNNIPDASAWATNHRRDFHPDELSGAVKQIGDPIRIYETPLKDNIIRMVRDSEEPIQTQVISDALDKSYANVHKTLMRLHAAGQIQRTTTDRLIYWSAA